MITAGHIVAVLGSSSTLAGRELGTAVVTFLRPEGSHLDELPLPAGVAVQHAEGHVASSTATPTRDLKPLVLRASAHDRELDG